MLTRAYIEYFLVAALKLVTSRHQPSPHAVPAVLPRPGSVSAATCQFAAVLRRHRSCSAGTGSSTRTTSSSNRLRFPASTASSLMSACCLFGVPGPKLFLTQQAGDLRFIGSLLFKRSAPCWCCSPNFDGRVQCIKSKIMVNDPRFHESGMHRPSGSGTQPRHPGLPASALLTHPPERSPRITTRCRCCGQHRRPGELLNRPRPGAAAPVFSSLRGVSAPSSTSPANCR